jgi:hypothetical protein
MISRRVKPIMTIEVTQAMALKIGPFVWSIINFLSLMRRIIKMRTKGRTIPLRTCEKYMIGIRGKLG